MDPGPALIACCSKAGLAVIRALGAHNVPLVALSYGSGQIGTASRYVRAEVRCPDPAEDEAGFIAQIGACAHRWRGGVIFPTDDASLVALSRHRDALDAIYGVVAERWSVVRNLIEKKRTYAIARDAGIPCPKLEIVTRADDARAFARDIGFPCLLKPSVGHLFFRRFHAKMLLAHSMDELERGLESLGDYDGELMLCEFIPGPDTCGANYNSFWSRGEPLAEFTAQKVRLKPTLIGFPTVVLSRELPEVLDLGRRMAHATGISGFSCMEFKRDTRDGVFKLMEVNARHNYSGALATACGIDFPWLSYLAAQGATLPARKADRQATGRFWIDEERDIRGVIAALLRAPRTAGPWLEPWRAKKVLAVLSPRDPMPTAKQAFTSVTTALHRARLARSRDPSNTISMQNKGRVYGRDLGMDGKGSITSQ